MNIINIQDRFSEILTKRSFLDVLEQYNDNPFINNIKDVLVALPDLRSELKSGNLDSIDFLEILWKKLIKKNGIKGGNPLQLLSSFSLPQSPFYYQELLGIDEQFTSGFICNFPVQNHVGNVFNTEFQNFLQPKLGKIQKNVVSLVDKFKKSSAGLRSAKPKLHSFIEEHQSDLMKLLLTFEPTTFSMDNFSNPVFEDRVVSKSELAIRKKDVELDSAFNGEDKIYKDLFSSVFDLRDVKLHKIDITCSDIYININNNYAVEEDNNLLQILSSIYEKCILSEPTMNSILEIKKSLDEDVLSDMMNFYNDSDKKLNIIIGPFEGAVEYFLNDTYLEPVMFKSVRIDNFKNKQNEDLFCFSNASLLFKFYLIFVKIMRNNNTKLVKAQKQLAAIIYLNLIEFTDINKLVKLFIELNNIFFLHNNRCDLELQEMLHKLLISCKDIKFQSPFLLYSEKWTKKESINKLIIFDNKINKDCIFNSIDSNFKPQKDKILLMGLNPQQSITTFLEPHVNTFIENIKDQINTYLKELKESDQNDLKTIDFDAQYTKISQAFVIIQKEYNDLIQEHGEPDNTDRILGYGVICILFCLFRLVIGKEKIFNFLTNIPLQTTTFAYSLLNTTQSSETVQDSGNILPNPIEYMQDQMLKQFLTVSVVTLVFYTLSNILTKSMSKIPPIIGRQTRNTLLYVQSLYVQSIDTYPTRNKYGNEIVDKQKILKLIMWLEIVLNNMSSESIYDMVINTRIGDLVTREDELLNNLLKICKKLSTKIPDYVFDEDNIQLPDNIGNISDSMNKWNKLEENIALKGGNKKLTIKNKKYKNKTLKGGNPFIIERPIDIMKNIILMIVDSTALNIDKIMANNYAQAMPIIKEILKPLLKEKQFFIDLIREMYIDFVKTNAVNLARKSDTKPTKIRNISKTISKKLGKTERTRSASLKSRSKSKTKRHSAPI